MFSLTGIDLAPRWDLNLIKRLGQRSLVGRIEFILTSGCVRMNSPKALSSVYPFTPSPVVRTRFAEEPYLHEEGMIVRRQPLVAKVQRKWLVSAQLS